MTTTLWQGVQWVCVCLRNLYHWQQFLGCLPGKWYCKSSLPDTFFGAHWQAPNLSHDLVYVDWFSSTKMFCMQNFKHKYIFCMQVHVHIFHIFRSCLLCTYIDFVWLFQWTRAPMLPVRQLVGGRPTKALFTPCAPSTKTAALSACIRASRRMSGGQGCHGGCIFCCKSVWILFMDDNYLDIISVETCVKFEKTTTVPELPWILQEKCGGKPCFFCLQTRL